MSNRPPLNDAILVAVARLVDDSQTDKREPSHSDIEFQIDKAKLASVDPGRQSKPVGKSKRVRAVLSWALSNDRPSGEVLVSGLLSTVQGYGGFRPASANYCGAEAIANLSAAFDLQGWQLGTDGSLQPKVLSSLTAKELTAALRAYVERARSGALDSPLVAGTANVRLHGIPAGTDSSKTCAMGSRSPAMDHNVGDSRAPNGALPSGRTLQASAPRKFHMHRCLQGAAAGVPPQRSRTASLELSHGEQRSSGSSLFTRVQIAF